MKCLSRHIRLRRAVMMRPIFAQLRRGPGDPTHRQVGDIYLRATRTPAGPEARPEAGRPGPGEAALSCHTSRRGSRGSRGCGGFVHGPPRLVAAGPDGGTAHHAEVGVVEAHANLSRTRRVVQDEHRKPGLKKTSEKLQD